MITHEEALEWHDKYMKVLNELEELKRYVELDKRGGMFLENDSERDEFFKLQDKLWGKCR